MLIAKPEQARLEFSRAVVPEEIPSLCNLDRVIFGAFPDDLFPENYWTDLESYWVLVDGVRAGCIAFQHNVDYNEEVRQGSLFIASTGLLLEFQGRGFGNDIKEWQIRYARAHKFKHIVTNARESNTIEYHIIY